VRFWQKDDFFSHLEKILKSLTYKDFLRRKNRFTEIGFHSKPVFSKTYHIIFCIDHTHSSASLFILLLWLKNKFYLLYVFTVMLRKFWKMHLSEKNESKINIFCVLLNYFVEHNNFLSFNSVAGFSQSIGSILSDFTTSDFDFYSLESQRICLCNSVIAVIPVKI
jgi:hypothetical protein